MEMIRNHDEAPGVLLDHLRRYERETRAWELRRAEGSERLPEADAFRQPDGTLLLYQFTERGVRYYAGRNHARSLVYWTARQARSAQG